MKYVPFHSSTNTVKPGRRAACLVAVLAVSGAAAAAGPKPQTELEHIFYDMGIIGYCGLSSDAASRGFHQQLEALVDRENIDPIQVRDARNRALTMVEWEWDNRGLGGFRGWCRDEGKAAVERFSD